MRTLSKICSGAFILAGLCIPSLSHAVSIKIERSGSADNRAISDVQCSVEFYYNGNRYYDYQSFSGTWPADDQINWGVSVNDPNHPWSCSGGQCSGDGLYYKSDNFASGIGQRIIIAKEDDPICYTDPAPGDSGHNIRVDCWFRIDNGDWHYDWEDFYPSEMSWGGGNSCGYRSDVSLYLNGCYGSWDGGKWVGDFLRRDAGSSC